MNQPYNLYLTRLNTGLLELYQIGTCRSFKTGKAIPLQAWTDPEGSRRLRLPDFKTVGT